MSEEPASTRGGATINRRSLASGLLPVPTTKGMAPTRRGFSPTGLLAGGIVSISVGLGMYVILAVLGEPWLGSLALAPGLVLGAVLIVMAERRRARSALMRGVAKSMARHLGLAHRSQVELEARSWTGGWVGTPLIVNVHYPAEVNDSAQTWAIEVADIVRLDIGIAYVVGRHNMRHRRLTLRDPRLSGKTKTPPEERNIDAAAAAAANLPTKIDRPRPATDHGRDWLVPLGIDPSKTTVAWDLRSPRAHLLVLGRGGTGKRVLVTGVVMEVATRGWPVWIVDHRRVDLLGLREWPNVQIVASTIEDQVVVVNQAWREMESRIAMIESGSDRSELEPLIVVVHQFREFAGAVAEWSERAGRGKSGGSVILDRIGDVLRHGHSVNVFLVLSVARTDDGLLAAEYRDQFGSLVALGRVEQEAKNKLWKEPGSDSAAPVIPGRAVVQMGDANPVHVQCYWTPDPRDARRSGNDAELRIVDQMRAPSSTHPPLFVKRQVAPSSGPTADPGAAWDAAMSAELVESRSGGGEANLAAWSRATTNARANNAPPPAAPRTTSGWSEVIMVSQLVPGNLARLDDDHGWVIVEQIENLDDPTKIRVHWRGSDGAGSLDMSRTRTVRIRHMSDGVY
ncbi:MAG TPA: hypothetical protein VIP77_24215 [Jiangellaceae bacterium]